MTGKREKGWEGMQVSCALDFKGSKIYQCYLYLYSNAISVKRI